MRFIFLVTLFMSSLFADLSNINSFEADFTQTIEDENGKQLSYTGHIIATKPQYALWQYKNPIEKEIYISLYSLTVIEPEIEQVIVRNISSEFNFFQMIKNAKKIAKNRYETKIEHTLYTIVSTKENKIKNIYYLDEIGNKISIDFTQEKINKKVDKKVFVPKIPNGYDIIEG